MKEQEWQVTKNAIIAIAPGALLAGVSGGIVFPILPLIGLQAGLPLYFIGIILAANRFARVIINPFVGSLVDRFGGRRVLVIGLFGQILVVACYLGGIIFYHPGIFFLIGRLLHGPSSSCVFVAGQTLALHAGGESYKGYASGIIRAAMSAGMPIGLVLGGILSGFFSASVAFEAAMIASVIAAIVATVKVPDLRTQQKSHSTSFHDIFSSLRNRAVIAVASINLISTFVGLGIILSILVLLVQTRNIYINSLSAETSAGLFMGIFSILMVITTPLAGKLSDHSRWRKYIVIIGVLTMTPGVLITGLSTSAFSLSIGMVLTGFGLAAINSPLLAILSDLVPSSRLGSAVGCLQLFGDLGATLGPIVGTSLIEIKNMTPYWGITLLLSCMLPLALWLKPKAQSAYKQL